MSTIESLKSSIEGLNKTTRESEESLRKIPKLSLPIDPFIPRRLYFATPQERFNHYSYYSGKRYIYFPLDCSTILIEYDIWSKTFEIYDLSSMISNFLNTSSCLLPNGDVFLAGFDQPLRGDVFIFRISDQNCIQVAPLSPPRIFLSLYYYQGFVYTFGGSNKFTNLRNADRFNLETLSWESLPCMQNSRNSISCIGIEESIYLFCGSISTIEIFHTRSKTFHTLALRIPYNQGQELGVIASSDTKIFLITQTDLHIFSNNIIPLTHKLNIWKETSFTLGNSVYHKRSIYFYNSFTNTINMINSNSLSPVGPLLQDPIISNRYIYRAKDKSSSFYRYDVINKTVSLLKADGECDRMFDGTSTCTLSNGKVIIAGFRDPVSNDCFLFNAEKVKFNRLRKLNVARWGIGLVCKGKYVYAFGGSDGDLAMNCAERYELYKDQWEKIPDMITPRIMPACVAVENKVYVIAGRSQSVEEFDINMKRYRHVNIYMSSFYIVSMVCDGYIYVLGGDSYKIFDKNMRLVEEQTCMEGYEKSVSTRGSTIYHDRKVYYFNDSISSLEVFKIQTRERKVVFTKR